MIFTGLSIDIAGKTYVTYVNPLSIFAMCRGRSTAILKIALEMILALCVSGKNNFVINLAIASDFTYGDHHY